MKCPVCNIDLQMAERQGVEIDYCIQCRGIWLDRGELDKIIERYDYVPSPRRPEERAREEYRQAPADRGRESDDYYTDKHGRRRKRRGIFEIFDIFD